MGERRCKRRDSNFFAPYLVNKFIVSIILFLCFPFIKQFSIIAASIPFLDFIHGMTLGKYNFQVRTVQLTFPDLPKAFDGFKLAQFSDFHAGSFDSIDGVRKGLKLLQEQKLLV